MCNLPLPKNNRDYWEEKFNRNVERDHRDIGLLEADGWCVVTIWECELRKNPSDVMARILATGLLKIIIEDHDGPM